MRSLYASCVATADISSVYLMVTERRGWLVLVEFTGIRTQICVVVGAFH